MFPQRTVSSICHLTKVHFMSQFIWIQPYIYLYVAYDSIKLVFYYLILQKHCVRNKFIGLLYSYEQAHLLNNKFVFIYVFIFAFRCLHSNTKRWILIIVMCQYTWIKSINSWGESRFCNAIDSGNLIFAGCCGNTGWFN